MSSVAETVPAALLQQGDFITIGEGADQIFAEVRRVTPSYASNRVLVDWRGLFGGIGTRDFAPSDEVVRVPEGGAKPWA